MRWLLTDDQHGVLAFDRVLGDQRAIVAFNISDRPQEISVAADGRYGLAFPAGQSINATGGKLTVQLPARSAGVCIQE